MTAYDPTLHQTAATVGLTPSRIWSINKFVMDAAAAGWIMLVKQDTTPALADQDKVWLQKGASDGVTGIVKIWDGSTWALATKALVFSHMSGGIKASKGVFTNLAALQTAYPTAIAGDHATLSKGAGTNAAIALWDADNTVPGWVDTSLVASNDASDLTSGTLADARLPSRLQLPANVPASAALGQAIKVTNVALSVPSAVNGSYFVKATATGVWAGQDNKIATTTDAGATWTYATLGQGQIVEDLNTGYLWTVSAAGPLQAATPAAAGSINSSVLMTQGVIASLSNGVFTPIPLSGPVYTGTGATDMSISGSTVTINTAGRYRFGNSGSVTIATSGSGNYGAFMQITTSAVIIARCGQSSNIGVASSGFNPTFAVSGAEDFIVGDTITFEAYAYQDSNFASGSYTPYGKAWFMRLS